MHTEADDPAGVLIHHDHYPVALSSIDSQRNRSTLHKLSLACPTVVSHDGPFGPGFLPPRGEYRNRNFRFFRALWNESRVEGLMIIAALPIRLEFRNNDQKPGRARSWVERFGARSLALLWIINCCFRSRFSAMIVRLPPGLISLARVVSR